MWNPFPTPLWGYRTEADAGDQGRRVAIIAAGGPSDAAEFLVTDQEGRIHQLPAARITLEVGKLGLVSATPEPVTAGG